MKSLLPEHWAILSSLCGLLVVLLCALGVPVWTGVSFVGQDVATLIAPDQVAVAPDFRVQAVAEFRARTVLTITAFLALSVTSLVLLYCLYRIRKRPEMLGVLAAIALVAVGFYVFAQAREDHLFGAYSFLLESVERFRLRDSPWSFRLVAASNVLFVITGVAFILSVYDHVLRCETGSREQLRQAQAELVRQLYLASALLVVSVAALHSFYSWPAALVDEQTARALRNMATLIAMFFGTVFTLLTVVVLGPALMALDPKIKAFAARAIEAENRESDPQTVADWLHANGFDATPAQQGIRLLATVGPILAGPVLELLKLTGG